MIKAKKLLSHIEENIAIVLQQHGALGSELWQLLLEQHPADIAVLITELSNDNQLQLLKKLPREVASSVFQKISSPLQAQLLIKLDIDLATTLLNKMHADELTDLFDHLSDEHLEQYLKLLQKRQRNQIISLLTFPPESAGGRMNSDVITLQKDFNVKKSIELLQRLSPQKDLFQRIYVTDRRNILIGYVTLDKLVFNKPDTILFDIIEKNELFIRVDEDQEEAARQIQHYELSSAPVVDQQQHFLGVITASDVVDILQEEDTEDLYKRFGLSTVEYSYFETPTWNLVAQRSTWLIGMLILQSVSSFIFEAYDDIMKNYLIFSVFLTMLIGSGGNAGNQSATLVIRGLTTKEMSRNNLSKVLLREFLISLIIGSLLAAVGFMRIYCSSYYNLTTALAINVSLFVIIVISMISGSAIPIILDFFGIDPAHSAVPFLATFMDILGTLIYCIIFSLMVT